MEEKQRKSLADNEAVVTVSVISVIIVVLLVFIGLVTFGATYCTQWDDRVRKANEVQRINQVCADDQFCRTINGSKNRVSLIQIESDGTVVPITIPSEVK